MMSSMIGSLVILFVITCTVNSANIRAAFDIADRNKNGLLDISEYVLSFTNRDDNGNGQLLIDEFLNDIPPATNMSATEYRYIFYLVDVNEDHKIVSSEITASFKLFDTNSDDISFSEYNNRMTEILRQIDQAEDGKNAMSNLFVTADIDKSRSLNADELILVFISGDKSGDRLVNRKEFSNYWSIVTKETVEQATKLFNILDLRDKNGLYGSKEDKKDLFGFFDQNADGGVSKDEFLSTMFFVHAGIMRELDMEKAGVVG